MLEPRQREIMRTLWDQGRLSRWELHERTGLTPNNVGTLAESLLKRGVLRECAPTSTGSGRPRVPLEIDTARRCVVGLAIGPGRVQVCKLGLRGSPMGEPVTRTVDDPDKLIDVAAAILKRTVGPETMAVGLSITGFVDPVEHTVLLSSALPGRPHASLEPLYQAAGDVPVILENDMHAMAARWLLTKRISGEDVLLVMIGDGRLGAAMLLSGHPNRGCTIGANELGHCRFLVPTAKCFCGHEGCLERIVSTDFMRRLDGHASNGPADETLLQRAHRLGAKDDPSLTPIWNYLGCALANAVNFVRPHRLVLTTPLARNGALANHLVQLVRGGARLELAERLKIDFWDEPAPGGGETAGWLALAEICIGGWKKH